MRILAHGLALCLALSMTGPAMSEPPMPEGGIAWFAESPCVDNESGQEGYCYLGRDVTGQAYLSFWQNDRLMLVRHVLPEGGYTTVWTHPSFNSF